MTDTQRVKYNPSVGEAAAARAKFSEGWMAAKVARVQPKQSKEKPDLEVSPLYMALNFNIKPLRDPEDIGSSTPRGLFKWQGIPLTPPHWAEAFANGQNGEYGEDQVKEFGKWNKCVNDFFVKGTYQILRALCPDEVLAMPRFEDGNVVIGDEIVANAGENTEDAYLGAKKAAFNSAGEKAAALYYGDDDVTDLEDKVIYIYLKYKDQRDPEIVSVRGEHPEENGRLVDLVVGSDILAGNTVEVAD